MAQVNVVDLTFCYEGSFDNLFENVSFSVDTDWKLGLIGRNGKGKTTFLNLLCGKYEYEGVISTSTVFDYFPYEISEEMQEQTASEFIGELNPGCEEWRVICELELLGASAELLYQKFKSLSFGERTKIMLAVLFSGDPHFLLIDEPTNHLDMEARELVKQYLHGKKGYILVSHDRDLLDACIDHVLVLNRRSIQVEKGNFSVWWENKKRKDRFSQMQNEKHLREIDKLRKSADRSERWAIKNENTKIGFDPVKEHDRFLDTRCYIGAKTKKMQARVKSFEKRMEREIEEKEGLLEDIEHPVDLKLYPLDYHKERLVYARDVSLTYEGKEDLVLRDFTLEISRGERVFLHGANGCGKSTLIKAILQEPSLVKMAGELSVGARLVVSYVNQDTGFLKGSIQAFCEKRGLDESLFCALLRQLDMERVQFSKNLEDFSEGQKKKVLVAASLMTPAHLYIWDEPLNYIDVFSRMQMEDLILKYEPTMLVIDHDVRFREKVATRTVEIGNRTHHKL